MIGDSTRDIESACRAGVATIAVLTGGYSKAELVEAGALAAFESLDELRRKLDDTPLGRGR
jgi:phosphoglycolate phosphatase-like HAD superfamily hydrolase